MHDDITWTSIRYFQWALCEGPISLISVCLPNIFGLVRSIHGNGGKDTLPGPRGGSNVSTTSTTGRNKQHFIRIEDDQAPIYTQEDIGLETFSENNVPRDGRTPGIAV